MESTNTNYNTNVPDYNTNIPQYNETVQNLIASTEAVLIPNKDYITTFNTFNEWQRSEGLVPPVVKQEIAGKLFGKQTNAFTAAHTGTTGMNFSGTHINTLVINNYPQPQVAQQIEYFQRKQPLQLEADVNQQRQQLQQQQT